MVLTVAFPILIELPKQGVGVGFNSTDNLPPYISIYPYMEYFVLLNTLVVFKRWIYLCMKCENTKYLDLETK